MALRVGTRLGAYEITGDLGAGGMGEVYRATDTDLKREVAIKILPPAFASDADRIARFQREAEALAALNHPNIAQIYGIERSGETTALAMELVEGLTLADRIAEGPIPTDEALTIAMQIADALEAAHEQNIVHRDLKPANVKIKSDGTVKVLDFGIATAPESAVVTSGQRSPTLLTPALTEAGVLLGTAAYMSPEQARGKAVDRRADIWAFGCVLYEMLTGQPAFGGEDVTTTLARVLEREANTTTLPATVPPAVRHTIGLCLQKDVRKRIADIHDVRLALEGMFESAPQSAADKETVVRPLWRRALPLAAAAVIAGVVAGFIGWSLRPETPPQSLKRFSYAFPAGQTLPYPQYPVMAFSADGRRFVYRTGEGLYVRSLDQLGAQFIAGTKKQVFTNPVLSPDGQSVAYFVYPNKLERIAISGGEPQVIANVSAPFGASWASDDTILYGQAGGIFRVSANGGMPQLIIKPKNGERPYGPELLPDGDTVLFSATTTGNWDDGEIVAQSLSSGKRTVLVKGGSDARYVAGRLIYARGDRLFGIAFDPKSLTVSGNAVPLVQGVMRAAAGPTGTANYGVSKDGTLVYVRGSAQSVTARDLVWVDDAGHETPVPLPPRAYDQAVISPDGTHAALGIQGDKSVWIADLKRGTLERLPADVGETNPTILFFSTDGQRVASSAVRDGRQAVVWQAVDGTGSAKPLVTFDASVTDVAAAALSPDSKRFVSTAYRKSYDLGAMTVGDPKSYHDFLATPANEATPAISPDGHWIAYTSDDTGTFQVYVQRFPEGGGRLAVSIKGGAFPHWSADGKTLSYIGLDGPRLVGILRMPVTLPEAPKGIPTFGTPKELFPWKYYFDGSDGRDHFDVTADGKRFLMITTGSEGKETARFVVVTHWVQELKRLVPTK